MSLTKAESKNLQALLEKKGRRAQGRFLAEGVRLLEEAVRFSFAPAIVYYSPALIGERGQRVIEQFRLQRVTCEELAARQIEQLTDTKTPQGIVGVFNIPAADLAQLYTRHNRTILVCDNVSDPGNLGTLLRSALAFDFRLVILLGSTAEPWNPKVVRASVGAVFGLSIAVADYDEWETLLTREKVALVASTVSDSGTLAEVVTPEHLRRFALAVGSEAEGLSPRLQTMAAARVRISHSPNVESLNAAVAGSILMKGIYDLLG